MATYSLFICTVLSPLINTSFLTLPFYNFCCTTWALHFLEFMEKLNPILKRYKKGK